MATNNRDNFDYENYARIALGATDEDVSAGINEQQKDMLYKDAVTNVHELNLKDSKGSNKSLQAAKRTIEQFDDARSIIGVPDEVQDFDEPYKAETLNDFLNTIHESNRDLPVESFLGKYTSQFYDGEYSELERPFLQDISKTVFKQRLRDRLNDRIDFDGTVSDAISKLEAPVVEQSSGESPLESDDGSFLDDAGEFIGDAASAVGRFTKNMATGFYNATVDTATGGLRLADSLLNDPLIDEVFYDKESRTFKRITEFGIKDIDEVEEQGSLASLADIIKENISINPEVDGFVDELALAAGQMLTFLTGAGIAGKVAGKAGATTTATSLGINQGAESGYQDYINTIQEQNGEFDPATARAATQFNALIGASESLPVLQALSRLTPDGKAPIGTLLKKIDDATGNSVSRAFNKVAQSNAGRKVADSRVANITAAGAIGAVQEGGQEVFAEIASNLVASDILEYDPNRGFVTDETVTAGQIGGIIGAVMNSIFAALPGPRRKQVHDQFTKQPEVDQRPGDFTGGSTEPRPPSEPPNQPLFNEIDGVVIADIGGVVGVGTDQESAVADLNAKVQSSKPEIIADIDPEYEFETENIGENRQRSVLKTDEGRTVTIEGDRNAESELRGLIESYNSEDPSTVIPAGLFIEKTEDGYKFTLNDSEVTATSLSEGLATLNSLNSGQRRGPVVEITAERIPEPSVIPIGINGFDPDLTESDLIDQGFTVLRNQVKSAKSAVTPRSFRAYKDGFIYNVKVKRSGKRNRIASVEIYDVDGNKYSPNRNESGQEYLVNGVLQPPVDGPAIGRNVNVTPTVSDSGGVVLRQPSKGIRVIRGDVSNSDGSNRTFKIDAQSVDEVANRLGAEILHSSSNGAVIEKDGVATIFTLDEQGTLNVQVDGESRSFTGPFALTNTGRQNEMSLSTMTAELEAIDYRVTNIDDEFITLENDEGSVVSLRLHPKDEGVIEADMGDYTQDINSMADFRQLFELPQPIDPKAEIPEQPTGTIDEDDGFISQPDSLRMVRDKKIHLERMFDLSNELAKVQDVNGKPGFIGENGVRVVLDVDPGDVESTLEQIRTNASIPTDYNIDNEIRIDYTQEELDAYLNLLPRHIREIIHIHKDFINPASEIGALGYFTPLDDNNRPAIHIDANPTRDFHSVLSTISEEVAHFSFDSWNVPELTTMFDEMYRLVKDEAVRGLGGYIERYNIDLENPLPVHKWVLVNEFFSKQGTSFIDFDDRKIELPPGVSRERMHELKRSVVDKITKLQLDLTKDFAGNQEDATNFIENIIRLQAGGVVGRGVQMTYHVERDDGTPATIEIITTPYGRRKITTSVTEEAKRIAKYRRRLAELTGRAKQLYSFYLKNILPIAGNPAIGRGNTVLLDGVYRPASSAEATRLKRLTVNATRVRAMLDTVGIGEIPISTSYLKTFTDNGLTSKTQLKLATEMDDFMKYAFSQVNNNVAKIRAELRESKKIIATMVGNHPGAERNLSKWYTEIDLNIRRFSSDWDHISYEAYQPGGDQDLLLMKDAVLGTKEFSKVTLDERVDKAEKQIRKIKGRIENGKLGAIDGAVLIKEQERIINVRTRLEALRSWAIEEVGQFGKEAVRGKILDILRKVTNENHSYNLTGPSASDKDISALKARKLDENEAHDRDFMTFLGKINDPLRVSISNLEQQNKVLNNIAYTTDLAKSYVDTGLARPVGSSINQSEYFEGDTSVFANENAGLLNFLEFDPEMAPFVKEDLELTKSIVNNTMGQYVDIVRSVKIGKTVLNPVVLASNYISNLSVLTHSGQLGYFSKYADMLGGIKHGWKDQVSFGKNTQASDLGIMKDNPSFGEVIAREMSENNVFQSSVGSLDAALTDGTMIERLLVQVGKFVGFRNKDNKIKREASVQRMIEVIKKGYAFGDEWAKVLPYLINRELAVAKAKTTISRDEFKLGKEGEAEYERAVLEVAIPEAADRTLRETNTWIIAPQALKKVNRNGLYVIWSDFLMHSTQVARIVVEGFRLAHEDRRAYKRAKEQGHTQYAKLLKNRILSRYMGMGLTVGSGALIAGGFMGMFGHLTFLMASAFTDDDEDNTPLADRKALNYGEMQAALEIDNIVQSAWGGTAMYPISRDGYNVTYYNGQRLSAMGALMPVPKPTVNSSAFDAATAGIVTDFINIDKPNILATLVNLASSNTDQYGRDRSIEDRVREFGDLMTPELFQQGYSLTNNIIDVLDVSEAEKNSVATNAKGDKLIDGLFALAGIKTKTVDIRDQLVVMGYMMTNQTNSTKNHTLRDFKNLLTSGDELSPSEVREAVKRMVDNNDEAAGYVNYAINAYRDFGLSYDEIGKHLKVRTDGVSGPKDSLSNKLINKFFKGENGYHSQVITQLKNKREDIKDNAKESRTLSREDIKNKIDALDSAIDLYEQHLRSLD